MNRRSHLGPASRWDGRAGSPQPAANPLERTSARSGVRALPVWLRLFCFFMLTSVLCPVASAQYAIDWSTVDGGGGTSTGGVYSVSGTIGQPDAGGPMTNGQYSVVGGFWSVIAAVQTPGAPTLRIYHTNGVVTVAWEKTADGWVLERTNALPSVTAPWPAVPPPYQTNAADLFITTNAPVGHAFFRLHKP